jgi:hypothetical protein
LYLNLRESIRVSNSPLKEACIGLEHHKSNTNFDNVFYEEYERSRTTGFNRNPTKFVLAFTIQTLPRYNTLFQDINCAYKNH